MTTRASLLALTGEALRLCYRYRLTFVLATLLAFGAQFVIALETHLAQGTLIAVSLIQPTLATIVYAHVAAAGAEHAPTSATIWERILERLWAVIVLQFLFAIVGAIAMSTALAGSTIERALGAAGLLLTATLVFSDAIAAVCDELPVWWLLPGSLARSVRVALSPGTFGRAILLLCLGLLIALAQNELYALLNGAHVAHAEFWSQVPLATLLVPPISALVLLTYLDAARADVAAE